MINFTRWIELYSSLYEINPENEKFFCSLCDEFPQHAKALNVEAGLALLPSKLAYKYDVTVTDSYPEFIRYISTIQAKTEVQPPTFHINSADIARYLGKEFFNVIFCINSRLIFLKERTLIEKLMFDAKTLLTPGGYLVFDLLNFNKYDLTQDVVELPVRKTKDIELKTIINKDKENACYTVTQQAKKADGQIIDVVSDEKICPITYESFKQIADRIGFSSVEFYSDYNKTPYKKDGYKVICVFKK